VAISTAVTNYTTLQIATWRTTHEKQIILTFCRIEAAETVDKTKKKTFGGACRPQAQQSSLTIELNSIRIQTAKRGENLMAVRRSVQIDEKSQV
jgi:hypothetical protein